MQNKINKINAFYKLEYKVKKALNLININHIYLDDDKLNIILELLDKSPIDGCVGCCGEDFGYCSFRGDPRSVNEIVNTYCIENINNNIEIYENLKLAKSKTK